MKIELLKNIKEYLELIKQPIEYDDISFENFEKKYSYHVSIGKTINEISRDFKKILSKKKGCK